MSEGPSQPDGSAEAPDARGPLGDALVAAGLVEPASAPDPGTERTGFDHEWPSAPERIVAIARTARAEGYFLEMLTCEDRREDLEAMRLVYTFNRWGRADRHLVHFTVPFMGTAPTLTGVYKAADWNEREVWDLFGVRFDGHPGLGRLLLPDDVDFHALLKDFGRPEDAPPAEGSEASGSAEGEGEAR